MPNPNFRKAILVVLDAHSSVRTPDGRIRCSCGLRFVTISWSEHLAGEISDMIESAFDVTRGRGTKKRLMKVT